MTRLFYDWYSISYYWHQLRSQLYLIPFCLFILGLLITLLWKEARARNRPLLLFLIGNYLLFTPLHKDPRYTMPMLVGVSLIAVFPLALFKNGMLKMASSLLLFIYCSFAFYFISFGQGDLTFKGITFISAHGYLIGAPTHENWYQEEMVRTIADYPPGEREVAFPGQETMYFNGCGLSYFSKKYGVQIEPIEERPAFLLLRGSAEPTLPKGYHLIQRNVLPDGSLVELCKR